MLATDIQASLLCKEKKFYKIATKFQNFQVQFGTKYFFSETNLILHLREMSNIAASMNTIQLRA